MASVDGAAPQERLAPMRARDRFKRRGHWRRNADPPPPAQKGPKGSLPEVVPALGDLRLGGAGRACKGRAASSWGAPALSLEDSGDS